jgi:hypothetical protein
VNDLQRTPEWYSARLGKWTGSRVPDATARIKSGWGASRKNYMIELLLERLTGQRKNGFVSQPMQDGIDRESNAVTLYEFERNVSVEPVGFIPHPRIPMSGTSPDGLVGSDGSVSIKCPIEATHYDTWDGGSIDGGYIKSMQWEMAVTGRQWCDFVSYCPTFPVPMQLVIRRVQRDEEMITNLEKQCREFLAELDEKHRHVLALANGRDDTTLRQLKASVEALGA